MSEETEAWLNQWVRPELRTLKAYPVPDATGLIKLDAMENPFPWPESLSHAWLETLGALPLNRYPDPESRMLKLAIREAWELEPGLDLLLGNGSDELIQLLAMTFSGSERVLLTPVPGFVVYSMVAVNCDYHYVGITLKPDFSLDLPAMLDAIETYRPALVFIAYPNNPTGNCFDPVAIREIAHKNPGLTVIDEAYYPFADHSFLSEIAQLPRTVLLRTFSKMGFAGLRLGVMVGAKALIQQVNALRMPYNINTLTQASVTFSLQNFSLFEEQIRHIRQERDAMQKALKKLPGILPYPTEANFVLVKVLDKSADYVASELLKRRILIKNLSPQGGLLDNCLRISVGTHEENRHCLAALHDILTKK
jgi:histidinol-phosphate aminotransferase